MKPLFLFTLWSYRNELKVIILSFIILISLPVVAVFMLTHAGIDIVSDRLATVDSKTQKIEIHDPATGEVIKEISPVMTWPVSGVVTLEFGESNWPFQPFHSGIDIANSQGNIGDPIVPFMDGTVIYAGEIFWGFGKHIIIDHGDNISSIYAHLSKIYVYPGQKVKPGDIIGLEGSTGWSTGPHLHFEIRIYAIPVNPRTFFGNENSN